jgi:alcohol dehydrogenase
MYPPQAVSLMANLIRAGLIDLSAFEIETFGLDAVNKAVAHAAAHAGPFRTTVIRP